MGFPRRGLGWRPDKPRPLGAVPDYSAAQILGTAPPPASWSNRDLVLSVLDQGAAGTCVAHAIPQAIRMAHVKAGIANPQLMSRLLGYFYSRAEDGDQNDPEDGTYLRSFFRALNQVGFCPESAWPYDIDNRNVEPPAEAQRLAYDQRTPTVYQRIVTAGQARVDDIKRAIAAGYGVAFGTNVSEAFCSNDFDPTIPLPPPLNIPIAGGHALCGAEYDPGGVKGPNSWTTDWGADGWFYFSWDLMVWDQTTDLWIVTAAPQYSEAP